MIQDTAGNWNVYGSHGEDSKLLQYATVHKGAALAIAQCVRETLGVATAVGRITFEIPEVNNHE